VTERKRQLLEQAVEGFDAEAPDRKEDRPDLKPLRAKIGQQALE
jgi:hypothetical protein